MDRIINGLVSSRPLISIIESINSFPWNYVLYVAHQHPWDENTLCLVLDPTDNEGNDPDEEPVVAKRLRFKPALGVSETQEVVLNAESQLTNISPPDLIRAFNYYYSNDAFMEFSSNVMRYIDSVNSEGGPFLLADAIVMRDWHGSGGDGSDYERACQLLQSDPEPPGALLPIGVGKALVWDPYGAGTGDVFMDEQGGLTIIRAWLDEHEGASTDDELRTVTTLATLPPTGATSLGSLKITCGVLAILWAPESGECIEALNVDESERPTGEMATDSSGLLVRIATGNYTCLHDEFELEKVSARRCHLIKQETPAGA